MYRLSPDNINVPGFQLRPLRPLRVVNKPDKKMRTIEQTVPPQRANTRYDVEKPVDREKRGTFEKE